MLTEEVSCNAFSDEQSTWPSSNITEGFPVVKNVLHSDGPNANFHKMVLYHNTGDTGDDGGANRD